MSTVPNNYSKSGEKTFMSFSSVLQREKRECGIWETYKNMAHSPYSILLELEIQLMQYYVSSSPEKVIISTC